MISIEPYLVTVTVLGLMAALLLVQLLIADVVALKAGHKPGYPVTPDHSDMVFRSGRSIANSNESIAIFILGAGFAIALGASPIWVNVGALIYFGGRVAHMLFYYANVQLLRSVSFVVSLVGLSSILIAGFRALL